MFDDAGFIHAINALNVVGNDVKSQLWPPATHLLNTVWNEWIPSADRLNFRINHTRLGNFWQTRHNFVQETKG